jgi:dual specificity phosphatase 12
MGGVEVGTTAQAGAAASADALPEAMPAALGSGQAAPPQPAAASGGVFGAATAPGTIWYRCAKCRTHLFSSAMLEEHEPGGGQAAFAWKKREAGAAAGPDGCTSHFLQSEFADRLGQADGKLACPKCAARLGGYNWSGAQCACGAWVTPAFQVVKSKVDASTAPPPQARATAAAPARPVPRQPRFGLGAS